MNAQVSDLDFDLAVTTWKTLWLEACNNQVRADNVWLPTQHLLDELTLQNVSTLTCFAGKHYMLPSDSDGIAVNLFFIGAKNEIAYLGTLLDPVAYLLDKNLEVKRLAIINPLLAQKLSETRAVDIVRDAHFCKIPVGTVTDTAIATSAVYRYLTIRAPNLAKCAINWLPHQRGIELEQRIRAKAEESATKPTKEDRRLAMAEDELEL